MHVNRDTAKVIKIIQSCVTVDHFTVALWVQYNFENMYPIEHKNYTSNHICIQVEINKARSRIVAKPPC